MLPCAAGLVAVDLVGFMFFVCLRLDELDFHMLRLKRVSVQQPSWPRAVLSLQISWEVDAGAADKRGFSTSKAAH